jgi:hypothetical protein
MVAAFFYNFGQTGQTLDKTFVQWTKQLVQLSQGHAASCFISICIRAAHTEKPSQKVVRGGGRA